MKYDYDLVGNRLEMTKAEGDSLTTTKYEYNKANELTRFNVNDGPFTEFKYDDNGNRTAKIEPGNRITSYSYDLENRLTKVQLHQDKWVGFEYDGDGNRITKLSAMTQPQHDQGIGNDEGFVPPGKGKVKKQQAELINVLLAKGGGSGGGKSGGSGSSNGNSNSDKSNNGNKDKSNYGKGSDKPKNKDIPKVDREKKKEQAKAKKGYRQKGKYTNRGKHKGWYKNGKLPGEKVEVTYYLNDVSDPLSQVLMTYGEDGKYDAAYTYGIERIEVEALDETRPEAQDPLYYLYDGLGSVTFMVKPDGNKRDHYRYDEYGKPAPGNSKLSSDGVNVNHNSFGYTGEMWDEESELLYLRARYYEPETGRFLSRDSYEGELDNPLSKHLYAYVQNNPVNNIDPTGHTKLLFNGQPTNVRVRNVKGRNVASLRDLANTVGATTRYYSKSRQASITYKGNTHWYSQNNFYTENGKIQIAVKTFANNFGFGINWSGRGIDQVINLYTQGTRQNITFINVVGLKEPPSDSSGYKPPKGGPKKGKTEGGKIGWVDKWGNIWVPDPSKHGGEHWDVNYPNGGYDNGYVRRGGGPEGSFSPIVPIPALIPKGGAPTLSPAYGGMLPLIVPTEIFDDEFLKEIGFAQPT